MRRMLVCLSLGVLLSGAFVWLRSEIALNRVYAVPNEALVLDVQPSDALLERGRHIATAVAQCQFCHGPDLSGREIADDPLLGQLRSTNLTAGHGGIGEEYSTSDWVRALRFGVGRDGRSLMLMPSVYLSRLTDRDLAAVITYLKQVPPVDIKEPSAMEVGLVTRVVLSVGAADDLMSAEEVANRRPGQVEEASQRVVVEGKVTSSDDYLVDVGNCRICHHADLRGGLHPLALPNEPPPSDLRPGGAMAGWRLADFEKAMRSGVTPEGRLLDREYMPWPAYAALSDAEIESLWAALSQRGEAESVAGLGQTEGGLPSVSGALP